MAVTRNARLFLERAGLRPTFRRPVPTMVPGDSLMHAYPLDRPLPLPGTLRDGFPAPDRPSTGVDEGDVNDPWHIGPED